MQVDKIIITNLGALKEKYGNKMSRIDAAIGRFIAADKKRGLETKVVAVDSAGNLLPPVPIAIDVQDAPPDMLDLRSDMTADPDGKVLPVSTGTFSFRIRTICEEHSTSVRLQAEVSEP